MWCGVLGATLGMSCWAAVFPSVGPSQPAHPACPTPVTLQPQTLQPHPAVLGPTRAPHALAAMLAARNPNAAAILAAAAQQAAKREARLAANPKPPKGSGGGKKRKAGQVGGWVHG